MDVVEGFEVESRKCVSFNYRNWQGKQSLRHVQPIEVYFGSTPEHEDPQWLMRSYDLDKQSYRTFALRDMLSPAIPYHDYGSGV